MKINKKKQIKIIKFVVLITTFTLLFLYVERRGIFDVLDSRTFDLFNIVHGEKEFTKHVSIVEIDEETLLRLNDEPISFWGPYFAKVINRLREAGAKTIGIDTSITVSVEKWLSKAAKVNGLDEEDELRSRVYDVGFRTELSKGDVALICSFIKKNDKVKMNFPDISYVYSLPNDFNDVGIANLIYDNDGIVRRFAYSYFDKSSPPYLSFAALLAKKYSGATFELIAESRTDNIHFFGPPGTFRTISFSRFLEDEPLSEREINELKDKIVIVAFATDTGYDLQQTPYATRFLHFPARTMSGGELHANIIETILANKLSREMTLYEKLFYLLIFSLISSMVFFRLGNITGVITIIIFEIINLLFAYLFFNSHIYVPLTCTFLVTVTNYLLVLSSKFTSGEREKAYLRNMFERYVSQEVVKEMIETGTSPALGGETKEVTILFSDIRNFTTISEILQPDEVVEMLNKYFTIICNKILKAGGTVDKFIGDAIMVIFGAPLYYEDHADMALETAMSIAKEAKQFAKWMEARFHDKYDNLPEFDIGIGLHSGSAIIGNVGSLERFEFTAIGDTVNIASRLEGLSKNFESSIIVSRDFLDKVKGEVRIGRSEMQKVKGKSKEMEVIEVLIN
ncbi:CHASE2 domain-containing protein [Thermodesulfobacteriota bacterium]